MFRWRRQPLYTAPGMVSFSRLQQLLEPHCCCGITYSILTFFTTHVKIPA